MRMEFEKELESRIKYVEDVIRKYLPAEEGFQKSLLEAMNYSFLAGGKRLRPLLMLECCRMYGGDDRLVWPFMAAQEMIHTYSLCTTICRRWITISTAEGKRLPMRFTGRRWRSWQATDS